MGKPENFLLSDSRKSTRGIADGPEPEVEAAPPVPDLNVPEILDILGQYFDKRLNEIEAKLDKGCNCQKK